MNSILIVITSFLLTLQQTETYFVVKIKGNIIDVNTGLPLKQGDLIDNSTIVQFASEDALALLVTDTEKKYILQASNNKNIDMNTLNSIVKDAIKFTKKDRIKTRGLITNADIKDLKSFLGEEDFTVIGNSLTVTLSKPTFENQSVEAVYDKNGKPFNAEFTTSDCQLKISRADLGIKSIGEVKIYHVDVFKHHKQEESVEKVTRFDLNFIDEFAIRDEMKTIIAVYKKKNYSKPQMKSFLMDYFVDFYGNTHLFTLSEFVDKIIEDNMK